MNGINWRSYSDGSVRVQPHEPLERYCPGGYHPVTLGDTLHHGRYKITDKLGYGSQSTVWRVRDLQENKWASLKIKKADRSTQNLEEDPEIRFMKTLEKHYTCSLQDRPRRFIHLFDLFHHKGPNGIHNCLVMELLGPSLFSVLRRNRMDGEFLEPDTILRSSQQLLEGIQFAHEAGISHGDIFPVNIAFTCNQASTDEELLELLGGNPVTAIYINEIIPRTPHLPLQLVKSADWAMWFDCPTEDIRIIDWGLSFPVKEKVNSEIHTGDSRSPEAFFTHLIDSRQDLWQAGCVLYSLFYQYQPFLFPLSDHYQIEEIIKKLGPLPTDWEAKWRDMKKEDKYEVFKEDDSISRESQLIEDTFEHQLGTIMQNYKASEDDDEKDEYTDYDFETLKCLKKVLNGLLLYNPDERLSIRQVLSFMAWKDHRKAIYLDTD